MFVKDTESGKFLTSAGGWTFERQDGCDFGSIDSALIAARHSAAREFDILLYFPLTGYLLPLEHGVNSGSDNRNN